MRVENIQNIKYSKLNQPSFMAVDLTQPVKFSQQAIDTFVKTTKQNLNLSIGNNKNAFAYFMSKIGKLPMDRVERAYMSCMDSKGEIAQNAIDTFFNICDLDEPSFLDKLRGKKNNANSPYYRYGINFVSSILESSKNSLGDFPQENLDFAEELLEKYTPMNESDFRKVIKVSKNQEGVIQKANTDLFFTLNDQKSSHLYYSMVNPQTGFIDADFRDYIVKDIENTGKVAPQVFEAVKLCAPSPEGKDILDEYLNYRKTIDAKLLDKCLRHASSGDGTLSLHNFKELVKVTQEDEKLLNYYRLFRDKDKKIQANNIDFVRQILPKVESNTQLESFAECGYDDDRIISEDYTKNLAEFLRRHPKLNYIDSLLYCIKNVKDANKEVDWNSLETFYYLKRSIARLSAKDEHDIFKKTHDVVSGKDGNVIPELLNEVDNLLKDGFLREIPYLIKIAKNSENKFDKAALAQAKDIIAKTSKDEKFDMLEFLTTCKDSKGNFDSSKLKDLTAVQSAGIKSNIVKVANALKKTDGTLSQTGLDFVATLRKNGHHQIEKEMPVILGLCKDKNDKYSTEKMDVAKKIQSYKPHIEISKLLRIVLNDEKKIDNSKLAVVEEILKRGRSKSIDNVNELLKYAFEKNGKCDFDFLKLLIKISDSGDSLKSYADLFPAFKDFAKYRKVSSFGMLNLQQKRDIMRKIVKHQSTIQEQRFIKYIDTKILPKNDSDYCDTVGRLSHYLGINVKPLSHDVKKKFFDALDDMSKSTSEFMQLDFDKKPPVLELRYSLKDFENDVWNIVQNYSYADRTKILDYFGFELKKPDGRLVLSGFPSASKPDGQLAKIKDQTVQDGIKKITPLVIKFTQSNKIDVKGCPQLSAQLNDIIKAFPEFLTTIGKEQHHTHDYTLDVHLLKVLQCVYKDSDYKKLSSHSKKHMQIAALFHDLTKAEKEVDSHHPENSAFDMYYLLKKLDMAEKNRVKIYQVICFHSWLAWYNESRDKQRVAKDIAYEFRASDAFKMACILTAADLKGVKKHDVFYKRYEKDLAAAKAPISSLIHQIQKTAINLPQTKIPKASELDKNSPQVKTITSDGITNTVLYLKNGLNLKSVGFEENLDVDDLNLLVHGLDAKDSSSMFQALGMINTDALLSTSYVNFAKGNWRAFRQQGFILGVPSGDIQAAYWRDFGSGYKKGKNELFSQYLFSTSELRTYMSDALKKELNLNTDEYIELYEKIEDMTITQLDKYYPHVAKAYRRIINKMDISKRNYGRNYNEILVTRPRIQAVFCYSRTPDSIPSYLRRFAEKNDVPIVVFP